MKITSIEAIPLRAKFTRPFRFAGVDRVDSQNVIVIVGTDEGLMGFGEACPVPHLSAFSQQAIVHSVDAIVAPVLLGRDPTQFRPLISSLRKSLANEPFTLAALDTALLDLAGKTLNIPMAEVLGGRFRDSVPIHASVGWNEDSSVMVDEALSAVDRYEFMKVYLGRGVLKEDLDRLAAVKDAVGNRIQLMLDINTQWTATEFLHALPRLVDLAIVAVEQPIAPADLAGQARLVAQSSIDIVLDEAITRPEDVARSAQNATGTVVNVGLSKLGGALAAQESATIAYAMGLGAAVGSVAELGIAMAAGLHLSAALPSLTLPSYLTGYERYANQITELLPVKPGGYIDVPTGPGLGIAIDEAAIAEMDTRTGRR